MSKRVSLPTLRKDESLSKMMLKENLLSVNMTVCIYEIQLALITILNDYHEFINPTAFLLSIISKLFDVMQYTQCTH